MRRRRAGRHLMWQFGVFCRMGRSGKPIGSLWEDERGGAALEYALLAGGIFLAIVGAITFYIDNLKNMYNNIANNM